MNSEIESYDDDFDHLDADDLDDVDADDVDEVDDVDVDDVDADDVDDDVDTNEESNFRFMQATRTRARMGWCATPGSSATLSCRSTTMLSPNVTHHYSSHTSV